MKKEKLMKFKKDELIDLLIKEKKVNKNQKRNIKELNAAVIRLNKTFDDRLNIGRNKRVFIESVTPKGLVRTYRGYITHETPKHIRINVVDIKGNYNYIVSKDSIKKHIKLPVEQITGMKIWRGKVIKGWKHKKPLSSENS